MSTDAKVVCMQVIKDANDALLAGEDSQAGRRIVANAIARSKAMGSEGARDGYAVEAVVMRLSNVPVTEVEYLWQNRIALGCASALTGDPGLGKSAITLDIVARLTRGEALPDGAPGGDPCDVLLIGEEDDAGSTIRPRLEAAGGDPTRVHVLDGIRRGDSDECFGLPAGVPALEEFLGRNPDVKLIIVDPIGSFLGTTDTNRDGAVRNALRPLMKLIRRRKVALLIVGHHNKSAGSSAIYRATGSIAFVGMVRSAMVVAKDKNDPRRRFLVETKNNLAQDSTGLAYTLKSCPDNPSVCKVHWEACDDIPTADDALAPDFDPESRNAARDAVHWLKDLLTEGPVPVKQAESLAKSLGHSLASLKRARTQLNISTRKQGKGQWMLSLPPQPRSPAAARVTQAYFERLP